MRVFRKLTDQRGKSRHVSTDAEGVRVALDGTRGLYGSDELDGYLAQLVDDGLATMVGSEYVLPWDRFYRATESAHYRDLAFALEMPVLTSSSPVLESQGSLSDSDFTIGIRRWVMAGGRIAHLERVGGILIRGVRRELMNVRHWNLCVAVDAFSRRGDAERSQRANQVGWAAIRILAQQARANLDDFLARSVVLAPETLKIDLRRARMADGDSVVEVEPGFDGAPTGWLELFDKWNVVRDEYHLATPEGMVQVLVKPKVKAVLREIKRMPGRRMAGARAQRFVLNPYAALGNDAQAVIDEDQFGDARVQAGLIYERFTPQIERSADGEIQRVGLLIESVKPSGKSVSERDWLTQDELDAFIQKLRLALDSDQPLLAWRGHDLELLAETYAYLDELQAALSIWNGVRQFVSWDDVYDISRYSPRVEGIGAPRIFYSPYIVKKEQGEWLPEDDIAFGIGYQPEGGGEPVIAQLNLHQVDALSGLIRDARERGAETVSVPGLPKPLPIHEAERIVGAFKSVTSKIKAADFQPDKQAETTAGAKPMRAVRQALLLRPNIQQLDYEERRKQLIDVPKDPVLPRSLISKYALFDHQMKGLAWLQHLYRSRLALGVNGAVLADDMGLGKTLQLLAFMARLAEENPTIDPMLVVAPVALLQNWKQELEQFFEPGTLPLLIAYGNQLDDLKLPREAIDQRLREEAGLVNFLRRNWVGDAKLVLTTYETLRNLEFSFAPQAWSVMVCDEAQRIKNPAALVTRAAKKQKAAFKVACTGTPVENTLADLWCLFDLIQPGLLGALDEFGRRYRKPIEARTDEECARVEELRELIRPQILRRTKAQVADGLPQKIVASRCRKLAISTRQRQLYAKAVYDFKRRNEPDVHVPFQNHLGLLHYLRLLCTDPRRYGSVPVLDRPLAEYRTDAPKMNWLIDKLREIRAHGEKVIVFCEFRDIQRLLKHYIRDGLGFDADIINGETTPDIARADNRQKRIDAFQARPGFGAIILSPMAVGFGLNIQAANHVVHYTRTWNPAKEDQATDRAYRIGQTRDVHVYYPVVTAGDFTTFDAQLDILLDRKRRLAMDMLNGSGDLGVDDFSGIDMAPPGLGADLDPLIDMDDVRGLSGRYFEGLVAALWAKKESAIALCTPASGDKGVDVVAIADSKGWLIQTKVSSSADEVGLGWDAIKEVTGGEAYYRQQYPGVAFDKLCVTNQHFNSEAHRQAKLNQVGLVEGRQLHKLLRKYAVRESEVEAQIYSST